MSKVTEISANAQSIAQRLGITKYDIYGATTDSTSVQVDKGEPKQVKASNRASITVRVWNDQGRLGVTSTTDVDQRGLELALKTAAEASAFGATENIPDFSPEATAPLPEVEITLAEPAPVGTLIERLVKAEQSLLNAHDAIASVPYNGIAQDTSEHFYVNSDGAQRSAERTAASVYLYTKTEQEGRKPRSGHAVRVGVGPDTLDVDGCLQEATDKTLSHLDYQKIESGKYRVVLSPDAVLSLIRAFGNLYNAQSVLDNRSLSTVDSLNTTIASPLLSIYDDALHSGNVSPETFDGEGTPTRRLPIIENGVLTNFLHSAGTAKRMGAQPTGHASIGAKVSVGSNFLHITQGQPAETSYSLDDADNVVLIDDLQALHAGVNALQGSFSLPFDGWLIQKGKRTSIESATVAGDFRQLLQSIVYVSPDEEITPSGVAPHVWIDELSITGE
ncbi:peptidase u62 modulator of dna gyrase [Leptolyngbya sp. Heron Island J]|uniref:TldD/PmbA family protein n=1 Tax=Leptolyngbya sp. Heron Island J TaxID=1385935 RepID=UPI0003B99092|nr:TldD/PmbA family protein [Leptolyngbya sp. Heron Island J]ESA32401.1 peptidase u62 modulator of dna gyrase [Leptolyngbya sp. Heron Island J]